jgi:hypothetical protein
MKIISSLIACAGAVLVFSGCETLPPGTERGPNGTIAYDVLLEASEPGARLEVNGEPVGNSPQHIKIWGDRDGTFHDFGSPYYAVRAFPVTTNQYEQTRVFMTGHAFGPEDRIPSRVYFDMGRPAPPVPTGYQYPVYSEPPVYYGPPGYYAPGFRLYFGPGYYHPHPRYYRRW